MDDNNNGNGQDPVVPDPASQPDPGAWTPPATDDSGAASEQPAGDATGDETPVEAPAADPAAGGAWTPPADNSDDTNQAA